MTPGGPGWRRPGICPSLSRIAVSWKPRDTFSPGRRNGLDPFRPKKLTELKPDAAPRLVEATLRDLPADARQRFEVLLYSSLWGNRIDLSYAVSARVGAGGQVGR